jgi:G:T/U-mismatch repair DNA glycosylase
MSDLSTNNIERHPLQPFLPPDARLLMLGSFPPPKKRWCMDFFYPNRSNMMWEVFGQVFFGDPLRLVDTEHKTFRKEDIERLLCQKGIAIYDTARAVIRLQGNASDKYLQVVEKTDLVELLAHIPLCHDVVCTGQKSAETLCEDYHVTLPAIGQHSDPFLVGNRTMTLHRLPSTSRAYPLPLVEKARHYERLFHSFEMI